MRYPHDIKQTGIDLVGREYARCSCGSVLEFDTDCYGYVIESCGKCHFSRRMTPAKPRCETETVVKVRLPVEEGSCIDCDAVVYMAGGRMPFRCKPCAKERQRIQQREWSAQRRARRAA